MRWIDCFGPPGVGKSAILDEAWPPRGIPRKELPYPPEWAEFVRVTDILLDRIAAHPTIGACRSMTRRSFTKMNAVAARGDARPYIQTGFAQRGLGIGWRMVDLGLGLDGLSLFFELMPVSLGVVSLVADSETIRERNKLGRKPNGGVIDRFRMVPLMEPARRVAVETLELRRVPVVEMDTRQPVDENREKLSELASEWIRPHTFA